MYTKEEVIEKIENYFNLNENKPHDEIINYLQHYLDSFVHMIDGKFVGKQFSYKELITLLAEHLNTYDALLINNEFTPNFEKIAIKKTLYLLETYDYIDNGNLFEKEWITDTHFSNYPKMWLAMIFVFSISNFLRGISVNDILLIKNKYIICNGELSEKKIKNLKIFYESGITTPSWKYQIEMNNLISEIMSLFAYNNKIHILYNLDKLVNDEKDYLTQSRCLKQYISIYLFIIDNILYEKGFYRDDKQSRNYKLMLNYIYIIGFIPILFFIFIYHYYY